MFIYQKDKTNPISRVVIYKCYNKTIILQNNITIYALAEVE